ncbi:hypothetical protein EGW08_008663 [Elysia chlorotica]|uniref:Sulfotransferase domain-containing protein n=1 Tax=Elysia chlorotica TaxID=188477 RepID=A0A433TPR9_ELYCH|nr:hypothetical protein EGW08_008663 [Elysia chlorotica]
MQSDTASFLLVAKASKNTRKRQQGSKRVAVWAEKTLCRSSANTCKRLDAAPTNTESSQGKKMYPNLLVNMRRGRIKTLLIIMSMFFILYFCSTTLMERFQASSQRKRPPIPRYGPEIRQVVFAKVHKAASSTMQNILMRFALARNLDVVLPKQGISLSEDGSNINRGSIVPHSQSKQFYDILCNHVLYNEEEISKHFSKSAVRIAIVRDPVDQAVSALKFYYTVWDRTGALTKGFNKHKEDPINSFLRNPQDFYEESFGPAASYINNRMSVDLGFPLTNFQESKKNNTMIREFLEQVERQFDVVLISDYFDESLILMRRILRWPMKNIVYLKVNVGENQTNSVWHKKPTLNSTIIERFREWDKIDFQLYTHFFNIFLERIRIEPLFMEEVEAFRKIQFDLNYFCRNQSTEQVLRITKSEWTPSFTILKRECDLMSISELKLTHVVRLRQTARYEEYVRRNNATRLRARKY